MFAERFKKFNSSVFDLNTLSGLIQRETTNLISQLGNDLSAAGYGSYLEGVASELEKVPREYLPLIHSNAAIAPRITASLFGGENPVGVALPNLDAALRVLEASSVGRGLDYRQTAALVRRGVFAVTTSLEEGVVKEVKTTLELAYKEGWGTKEYIEKLSTKLEEGNNVLSPSHIENIFRTNVASLESDGRYTAISHPLVKDYFPYAAIHATDDSRTRENHKALEKLGLNGTNIYRADDPTFKKFRPPWAYQCRCQWHGVTVEQAAKKGIREAIEWLSRAKLLAKEKGGSYESYLNDTTPSSPEFVTPPDFEPSPEFKREFTE